MFAERLKAIRAEKGLTQVQLAKKLGVSKGTVAMWEIGKRRPNFDTLELLSHILDKRVDYILGVSNDGSSAKAVEDETEQLGLWAAEDSLYDTLLAFLCLDSYGKNAVEGVIQAEVERCKEHNTLFSSDNFKLSVRVKNMGSANSNE